MHRSKLSSLLVAFVFLAASGCAENMLSSDAPATTGTQGQILRQDAPSQGKLRHPQVMDRAISKRGDVASKYGAQNAHLFIAFAEYEADGVTRRVLDSYGVTRRILQEYGVTRRVLEEYGVTRRVLEEYGVTRRVMNEYGGLTWELLEAYGVTRRILDEYGVTRRVLEEYAETYEPEIDVRVRVSHVRPGITIAFVSDFLDTFLEEISDDLDIELVEPDVEMEGAPLYLKDGLRHENQMMPWNVANVGGLFTTFDKDNVDVFILDSGIYSRDLNVVEAKDFTMLFQNRNEEMWDDSEVMDMPFFDPGEMGDPADRNGHGTHGAGTIGAKNNDDGVKGLAPEARIHSLKVLTDDGRTDITTVVSAMDYVTDFKQQNPTQPVVANLSLGMDLESTAYNILDEAVKRAIDFGVVVIVSAGNDFADASTYSPAHVYEAITVGAYNRDNQFADFSNFGPAVDILAPGDAVVSLTHDENEADNDDNIVLSGTSSSAPHVAGAAALYLSQNPYASPAEVKQALLNNARSLITGAPQGTTNKALYVGFADDGLTKAFEVIKAEWDSYNKRLKFEGKGPRLDVVVLTNVARGSEIASLTIMDNGEWKYQVTEPAQIPCAVDVAYQGGTHEAAASVHQVLNAPSKCDPLVRFDKAEWKDDDEELRIEGRAPSGMTVVITDSQLGTELATVVADDDHKFEFETLDLDNSPCRVAAATSFSSAEIAVEDAHEQECSAGMGMSTPIILEKAEYDSEKDKLKIEGEAEGDSEITFYSLASGNSFGTETAAGGGSFRLQVENPSIIPCTVRAVSAADGSEAEIAVIKKGTSSPPSDCERSLTMENIEWNEGDQKLKLKGRGLYYGSVTFRSARTGAEVHTATIDNRGKFEDEVRGLSQIPCSLIIETQEASFLSFEAQIQNPSPNCEIDLVFNQLQYVGIYERLSAGGMATAGSSVTLTNPENGSEITTVQVAADRTWRTDLILTDSGALPPCRVLAVATNGDSREAGVSGGVPCDSDFTYVPVEGAWEQNPYSYIELSRAEYHQTARTLRVSGNSYEFMEIEVTNPATGEALGTFTNDDTPAFDFYLDITGTIPCAIDATLDGRLAQRGVSNTTDNCDDRPYLEMARWNNGRLEVEGLGGAGMSVTLSSTLRGDMLTTQFEADGSLSLTLDSDELAWVPCEVQLTSNGGNVALEVNGAPDVCDGIPVVDQARWNNGYFVFEATGPFNGEYRLFSTQRPELLLESTFDQDGFAELSLNGDDDLQFVPSELLVEYRHSPGADFDTMVIPVTNAPDHADGNPVIENAQWSNGALEIEAWGPYDGTLTISSVGTGLDLGSLTLDELGSFEAEADDLLYAPCEVRLTTSDGRTTTAPVSNAPLYCDASAWVDFGKAEWRSSDGRMILEGEAFDGYGNAETTITFHDAATGQEFHSDVTDDGEFELELFGLSNPACSVEIRVAGDANTTGTSAVLALDGACGN